jgi:hypothetical protein
LYRLYELKNSLTLYSLKLYSLKCGMELGHGQCFRHLAP